MTLRGMRLLRPDGTQRIDELYLDSAGCGLKQIVTLAERHADIPPGERLTARIDRLLAGAPADLDALVRHPYHGHWLWRISTDLRRGDRTAVDNALAALGPLIERTTSWGIAPRVAWDDPEIGPFLHHLNEVDPVGPSARGDRQAVPAPSEMLSALAGARRLLYDAWPELAAEIGRWVRLVVPFASDHQRSSSNTVWCGAIFIEHRLRTRTDAVERVVHEAGHTFLTSVMRIAPLHRHGPGYTVSSPYREGPRPVAGLIHGAFVFTRVAEALHRIILHGALDAAERDTARSRIEEALGLTTEALHTMRTLDLDDLGVELFEALVTANGELSDQYPRSRPALV